MAVHLRDGYFATCTSPATGTGAYTGLTTPAGAGWLAYSSLADGSEVEVAVRTATGWGEDVLATKSGGATPTLTRTQILSNSNGNTSPIDWPNGTPLIISSTVSGVDIASLLRSNTWQANQFFNGKRIATTVDGNSYFQSTTNTQLDITLSSSFIARWQFGSAGEPLYVLTWADSGANGGPGIILDRASSTPAHFDPMGYINFNGRNDAGTAVTYSQLISYIDVATAGSESGLLQFSVRRGGSLTYCGEIGHDLALFYPNSNSSTVGVLVGKTGGGLAVRGVELLTNGQVGITSANDPLNINRTGSDGNLVACYRDNVFKGGLVFPGNSSYPPTTKLGLSGVVILHKTNGPDLCLEMPTGTLLVSTDVLLPDGMHPESAISTQAADPAAYGVFWGSDGDGDYHVAGGGTGLIRAIGPVGHGDLLETSDIPGVARRQEDDLLRAATVAKARASVPAGEERLISCTLLAG